MFKDKTKRMFTQRRMGLIALLIALAMPSTGQATEILFEENFENYNLGSFPSNNFYAYWGGWWVDEEGGNKFLKSVDAYANYTLRTQEKFPGNTTIEFMYRSSYVNPFCFPRLELSTNPIPQLTFPGWWWMTFDAYNGRARLHWDYTADGISYEGDTVDMGPLTFSVQPGVWYKTKAILGESYANFYIDDSLIFKYDVSSLPFTIDNFFVNWGNEWGQKDLDNIKITRDVVPEPATLLLLGSGLVGLVGYSRKKLFKKA